MANIQGVLVVPRKKLFDDRGGIFHMLRKDDPEFQKFGEIYFSKIHPGVIKAWHRHSLQTDFWICLTGHIKVGVYREEDQKAWLAVIGEKKPGVMIIPPFYMTPTPDELFEHYRRIGEAISIPIMVYNNPATANIDISRRDHFSSSLAARPTRYIPKRNSERVREE